MSKSDKTAQSQDGSAPDAKAEATPENKPEIKQENKPENKPAAPAKQQNLFRRKLTPFLCREMLYDFATDQLDPERRAAVEEYLATDKESQDLLESIRKGITYASTLSKTTLAPEITAQLKDAENVVSLGRRYSTWKEWPETVRWSLAAVLISASVAGIVAFVPWSRLSFLRPQKGNSVEIAKIPTTTQEQAANLEASAEPPEGTEEGSGDDVPDIEAGPQRPQVIAKNDRGSKLNASTGREDGSGDDHESGESYTMPKPTPVGRGAAPQPSMPDFAVIDRTAKSRNAPTHADSGDSETGSLPHGATDPHDASNTVAGNVKSPSAPTTERREVKPKGFVYRSFMTLSDLDTLGPQIASLIRELGGEKAGEVELGWKRGTGRYYHFSLPEANEQKLLERLQVYGPVRNSKDPHPRIMPEGQVRFILWIESAN